MQSSHAIYYRLHGKVYSVQAPEVACLAKGKAHKRYEFGVKVGIVSTSKERFVIGTQALPGNPYDGHALHSSFEQVQRITGQLPTEAYVDRGYKGHGIATFSVWIAGAKRGVTAATKRQLRRRNTIEPDLTAGYLMRCATSGAHG